MPIGSSRPRGDGGTRTDATPGVRTAASARWSATSLRSAARPRAVEPLLQVGRPVAGRRPPGEGAGAGRVELAAYVGLERERLGAQRPLLVATAAQHPGGPTRRRGCLRRAHQQQRPGPDDQRLSLELPQPVVGVGAYRAVEQPGCGHRHARGGEHLGLVDHADCLRHRRQWREHRGGLVHEPERRDDVAAQQLDVAQVVGRHRPVDPVVAAGARELEVVRRARGVGALQVDVAAIQVQATDQVVVVAHERLSRRELGERLGVRRPCASAAARAGSGPVRGRGRRARRAPAPVGRARSRSWVTPSRPWRGPGTAARSPAGWRRQPGRRRA